MSNVAKKLVIVESPTKAKTLSKYLGSNYLITSSKGHIRDLPTKGLGIDIENNFTPTYEVPEKAQKQLSEIKKLLKNNDVSELVLATDPDREGEAIAWHLKELLVPTSTKKSSKSASAPLPFTRVTFHELTKPAIEAAFEHAGQIDQGLVNAQQARRVLDRLVGYKLSPLLWKKVRYGLSAGRVQSVAVRLIVERERERQAFTAVEYWSINGLFADNKNQIEASLVEIAGKKAEISNSETAENLKKLALETSYLIKSITKSQRNKKPSAPFKTSTLQQAAANVYGFTAKKTMDAAQKLFEKGLITYHRTDSLNLSEDFIQTVRAYLKKHLGADFVPLEPLIYKTNAKSAQEAHEAIRPTDLNFNPKAVKTKKDELPEEEEKIYMLILKRTLECQCTNAIYDQTSLNIVSKQHELTFRASGSVIKFEGWLAVEKLIKIHEEDEETKSIPEFAEGAELTINKIDLNQHFTQPPARYNDASLIKALEEMGIGRPSTYAPTINTIQTRGYIIKEGRAFIPTDVAFVVTDMFIKHFDDVINYEFTAKMEEDLDEIAEKNKDWVPVIKNFYLPFAATVEKKDKELQKADMTNLGESNEVCPECGSKLLIKLGKYGKFLSCSRFPECEYAKPILETPMLNENGEAVEMPADYGKCPNCQDGVFILKQGKFGKFLACSNYPKCKTTQPFLEKIGMNCPKCETGEVVVKKAKGRIFYGCSRYPDCDYSSWKNPKAALDSADTVDSTESIDSTKAREIPNSKVVKTFKKPKKS